MMSKIIVLFEDKTDHHSHSPWRQILHGYNTGRCVTPVLKGKKRRQTGADLRAPSPWASEVVGPVGWLRFTGNKSIYQYWTHV